MNDEILTKLMGEIHKLTPLSGTHGYDHVIRVYNTCLHIGQVENADMKVLLPAAILHDVAREEENHALTSARKAKKILRKYGYSTDEIEKIATAISTHSFSGNKPPRTLEGKILSDADKLDALGALGIYRTAVYSGEHARTLNDFITHFHEKLLKLESLMFTDEARKVAGERTRYMGEFVKRLMSELEKVT